MSIRPKKVRLCRQLGMNVVGTHQDPLGRRQNPPGQHGGNMFRHRKASDHKVRLLEKQRLRFLYNLREKQFAKYVHQAKRGRGSSEENLIRLLETRLDTVVQKSGFARTQREARQLVVHGHFHVNGRRVDRPSYGVRTGDVVTLKPPSRKKTYFVEKATEVFGRSTPGWLVVNKEKWSCSIHRDPTMEDVPLIAELNLGFIMEFYA
ncbi:30S ribosomal protein S4 [bacterium]|nr:30S ribosomal protein S4 [bacterium]